MFGSSDEEDKVNTPVEETPAEETPATADETAATAAAEAAANKPAETAALDHAADEAAGTDVAGEKVETDLEETVYFEGRKVVRFAEDQGTANKAFVRCEMSDSTTVDVPRELFGEGFDFSEVDGDDEGAEDEE